MAKKKLKAKTKKYSRYILDRKYIVEAINEVEANKKLDQIAIKLNK